jgi:hypothetical protein
MSTIGCTLLRPEPPVVFTYNAVMPDGDHRGGERVAMTWKATPTPKRMEAPERVTVCVGLAGPYDTAEQAKVPHKHDQNCPVNGERLVFASGVAFADAGAPKDLTQELVIPAGLAPGYYQVIGVRVIGWPLPWDAVSSSGIIRIV